MKTNKIFLAFLLITAFAMPFVTKTHAQDVQRAMAASPTRPLVFVKEIEIPGSDSLGAFDPKWAFSSNDTGKLIAKFQRSDSYDYLFFNNAQKVPANQPSLHISIYRTTGNTGNKEIDSVMTRNAPLSEIEYSHALMFLLRKSPKEIKDCSAFIVEKEGGYIYLSACWNTIVENGWLLVGNSSMSHGAGLLVFLRKK